MTHDDDRRMGVGEAATYLGVSCCTIYRYLWSGRLRGESIKGQIKRRWTIWFSDLEKIVVDNQPE